MTLDLTQVCHWLNSNKVTVNPKKSNLLSIPPKMKKKLCQILIFP